MTLRIDIIFSSKIGLLEYAMFLLPEILNTTPEEICKCLFLNHKKCKLFFGLKEWNEIKYWIKTVQLLTRFLIYSSITLHLNGSCVFNLVSLTLHTYFSWIPATGKLFKSSESKLSVPITLTFMLGDQIMGDIKILETHTTCHNSLLTLLQEDSSELPAGRWRTSLKQIFHSHE